MLFENSNIQIRLLQFNMIQSRLAGKQCSRYDQESTASQAERKR